MVWPLAGCPCSSGQPHTQEYMGNAIWIQWVNKNEDIKFRGYETGCIWEELGKGGEYDQTTMHEILKELTSMLETNL